jgi:hypothetical protein
VESHGKSETLYCGWVKEHHLLGGSHASPARPSDNDRVMWSVKIVISTGVRKGTRNFDLCIRVDVKFRSITLAALTRMQLNCNEFNSGRPHERHVFATRILGIVSAFA